VPPYEASSSERFLLYSVAEHEQLNKQRRALLHFMLVAHALGRTLVLPRVHQVRKDKRAWTPGKHRQAGAVTWYYPSRNEHLPMSAVYNLSVLEGYHPVVELAQLWALDEAAEGQPGGAEGQTGAAEARTGAPARGEERDASRRIDILFLPSPGPRDGGGCDAGADRIVEFNGLAGVRAAEVRCGASSNLAQLHALAHAHVIGFARSYDQVPEEQAKGLVRHLRFIDPIYAQAESFARDAFGDEPFLAVHWRRADFTLTRSARADVLLPAQQFVERVEAVLRERGLRHVYLATDSTDEVSVC
jgi:hypothetical protein